MNGNFLLFYSLLVKTICFPQMNIAAFAYPRGRSPLPFKTAGVIILSAKNSPRPAGLCVILLECHYETPYGFRP